MSEVRAFFESRVAHWDDAVKDAKPRWDTEVIATAVTLAMNDAATTGKLHPKTRQALDRIWTLQSRTAASPGSSATGPPSSTTTTTAPSSPPSASGWPPTVTRGPTAQRGPRRLKKYLRATSRPRPPPPDVPPLGVPQARRPDDGPEAGETTDCCRSSTPTAAGACPPWATGSAGTARRTRGRAERRIRDRPGRLRAQAGRASRRRPGDQKGVALAAGQPARVGPVVHPVAEQRQGPLHRQRRDGLRRDGDPVGQAPRRGRARVHDGPACGRRNRMFGAVSRPACACRPRVSCSKPGRRRPPVPIRRGRGDPRRTRLAVSQATKPSGDLPARLANADRGPINTSLKRKQRSIY